jgi:hypothetical protein
MAGMIMPVGVIVMLVIVRHPLITAACMVSFDGDGYSALTNEYYYRL